METLHKFVRDNELESIRTLIDQGIDVDSVEANGYRRTPLFAAIRENNEKIVQFLISVGADVDFRYVHGEMPLHHVSRSRNLNLAQMLIEAGADVNCRSNDGVTILQIASMDVRDDDGVKLHNYSLSLENINVNVADNCGRTALHNACSIINSNSLELIKRLLRHNADVNAVNNIGATPFIYFINANKFD